VTDLIYRLDTGTPFHGSDERFHWIDGPVKVLKHLPVLRRRFGWRGLLRLSAITATPSRAFFFLERDGLPVSHGRVSFGRCHHYRVEQHAAVLGEIWSDTRFRGQGLATLAMQAAINKLIDRRYSTFYIDTQVHNEPMRRVIDNCGFSEYGALVPEVS